MTAADPSRLPAGTGSDLHTHSNRTDGTASAEAMADAAVAAGLTTWGLSDHVRASTAWVPEYVVATRAMRRDGLEIRCGVEAKILDASGRLDLPGDLAGLDYVLVADHQFPGMSGPVHPAEVGAAIASGARSASDVVSELVQATADAVRRCPLRPVVAHPFSVLPKMGIAEDLVTDEHLDVLAAACLASDAGFEVNDKWRCPSPRVVVRMRDAGVPIVTGSDAHEPQRVGLHTYADEVIRAIGHLWRVDALEGPR